MLVAAKSLNNDGIDNNFHHHHHHDHDYDHDDDSNDAASAGDYYDYDHYPPPAFGVWQHGGGEHHVFFVHCF